MQQHEAATSAAIDIGSNSTEVLIAHCTPDHLDIVRDESTMTRLGESVKATGEIAPDRQKVALAALRQYQELAKQYGADPILVVATEAMREARNREAVVEDIQRETGLQVNVISGELEAALTYHGATYEPDIPPDAGVLDVGGGSTELIAAQQKQITWLTSLPIGSGWLHDQYLSSNPPTEDDVDKAEKFLHSYAKKFLNWHDKVLKHGDAEAVHKMRVASRRLRATLDAYESACKRKPFRRTYRRVKKAADLLGTVRDTDIMMQRVGDQLEQAPGEEKAGLQWLNERLGSYRQEREQQLEGFLRNFNEKTFKNEVKAYIPKGASSHGQS